MEKHIEKKLIDFWFDILPELGNDKEKLNNHLIKYLNINIEQAIKSYNEPEEIDELKFTINENMPIFNIEKQLFGLFFSKFISKHNKLLFETLEKTKLVKDKDSFIIKVYHQLYRILFNKSHQVFINELNYYRENGLLEGKNSIEEFNYFCNTIITSDQFLITLKREYSVFLNNLSKTLEKTISYISEILTNTDDNFQYIQDNFNIESKYSLIDIVFMGSDVHNDGKSVCKLIFEDTILIYKPKSLQLEKSFQCLLHYLNENIPNLNLYEMKIFTKNEYGWCEFIQALQCTTIEELERCYKRIGKLLAILYCLNGVDFHYENIIFKGENPVLVDLETLFNTPLKDKLVFNQSAFAKATTELANSVLSIGLLPTKMKLNEKKIISIGALDKRQAYDIETPMFENLGLSTMKISKKNDTIFTGHTIITNDNLDIQDKDILKFIKQGFIENYTWINKNKQQFILKVLDLFESKTLRIVIKPTMVYSQLLSAANHPDFLTRNIHRKIVLSRLGLIGEHQLVVQSEIQMLLNEDIPYFSAKFSRKKLYSSSNTILENHLYYSPKENFLLKMENLSDKELKKQLNYIDLSFFRKKGYKECTPLKHGIKTNNLPSNKNYIELAKYIGDLLSKEAIYGENRNGEKEVTWLDTNVANMDSEDWTPEVMSFDIYNGLSGLAIFYMNLSTVVVDKKNEDIITTIISMLKRYLTTAFQNDEELHVGMMTGVSGMLLVIYEYSRIFKSIEDEFFVQKEIKNLTKLICKNNPVDFVAGNVGAFAVMLKMLTTTDNISLKQSCKQIITEIILVFEKNKNNILDNSSNNEEITYSGFSHGLSGFIYYLYHYYKLTGDENTYNLFQECLLYQRAKFWSQDNQDWIVSSNDSKFSYGWCHGSPGILLEKMALKKLGYHDLFIEQEINSAIRNTIENLGSNISMCHGDIGNILILKHCAEQDNNETLINFIKKATDSIYDFINEQLKNEDDKVFKNFKGLMLGMAGVADFMLKSTDNSLIEYLW
ncbi:type 2 lanthipeptide synthetase LanM [Vagococcus fluvialis]|uniref:type 2 lanthipeptide synthetase LanM n=1 Tax=Vagococcus fluvialis TaxID=2738 RepID=UPI0020332691|nr:type 2 lanthipeptide synthetase LanM [Vagococcus fluvialis]MCM2139854.1 type 2 lanthipeptide synthetase LanM [Vagococcus fluvialis]URZ88909.1 vagococcin T modification enzyme vcnM1 [Vagococcus fluvialis]